MVRSSRAFAGLVGLALVGAACGAGVTVLDRAHQAEDRGDYFTATQNYLYEHEHATEGQYHHTLDDAARVQIKWIKAEIEKTKADEPKVALAKLLLLQQAWDTWLLGADHEINIEEVLVQTVARLLPTIATPEAVASDPVAARDKALAAIALLDSSDADPAKAVYRKLFADLAAKETAEGDSAARAGHLATAHFHRVRTDAYSDDHTAYSTHMDELAPVDAIAGTRWTVDLGSMSFDCEELKNAVSDYRSLPQFGTRQGTLHIAVTSCGPHVISDTVSSSYQDPNLAFSGTDMSGVTTTATAVDPRGFRIDVHELVTDWSILGTVTWTAGGESATTPFSYSATKKTTVRRVDSNSLGGGDSTAVAEQRRGALDALKTAARAAGAVRAKELVAEAGKLSDHDTHIDMLLTAARAGELPDDARAELVAEFHDPDLESLVAYDDFGQAPDRGYADEHALTIPTAHADADAIGGTEHLKPFIDARHPGGAVSGDADVGLMQSKTDAGASQLGLMLGFEVDLRGDPGPVESGVFGGLGWLMRMGYSNAFALDIGIPAWIGYRIHGVGVAAIGQMALDRYGSEGDAPLHVNAAFSFGYGLGVSVLTTTVFDLKASYMIADRGTFDGTPTPNEDRYELKATLVKPDAKDPESTLAKSLMLRYSSFTQDGMGPDMPGRMLALWFEIGSL